MGKVGRILTVVGVVGALSLPTATAASATNATGTVAVGNSGTSTRGYADEQLSASSGGEVYQLATPGGRAPAWYGLPSGSSTPVALTDLPAGEFSGSVIVGTVAVVTDGSGHVSWEQVDGSAGETHQPVIPTSNAVYTWSGGPISSAPGGWVTIGSNSTSSQVLLVSTSGTVTDLGNAPSADGSILSGPDGAVVYGYTSSVIAATYVPYASPNTQVPFPAGLDECSLVLTDDAVCGSYDSSTTTSSDVLVSLSTGAATETVPLPSGSTYAAGTKSDAAWGTSGGDVAYEPWTGGTVTTVSSGFALPATSLTGLDSELVLSGGDVTATTGLASLTPPATTTTELAGSTAAPVEASELAIGPGRLAWSDDADATGVAAGASPLWSRTLNTGGSTLSAGSESLVATDASQYSFQPVGGVGVSGARTLYTSSAGSLELLDATSSGGTPATVAAASGSSDPIGQLSGSRVFFEDSTGYHLYDALTGTSSALSNVPARSLVSLWGNYLAWIPSDGAGAVHYEDLSSSSPTPTTLFTPPSGSSCYGSGLFVSDGYVAWAETCSSSGGSSPLSGYKSLASGSSEVDLSSVGTPVALSG
ncbi:MAG: hypothetical protein ACRDYY_05405, partial [Acidimicrobiales bacterium]